jgi:hypothetical protein
MPFGPTTNAEHVYIHGDFGASMPRISIGSSYTIQAIGLGDRISYLELTPQGSNTGGVNCGQEAVVERLRITATGEFTTGVLQQQTCLVRDSVLRVDGTGAIAVSLSSVIGNPTAKLRNVTAISTGPKSVGVRSTFNAVLVEPGSETADLKNVIANGGEFDLEATGGIFGPGNIIVSNSNFDSTNKNHGGEVSAGPGNQTAAPLFVDAASGDYREAPGSPTIDAGAADPLDGELDLAGNQRSQGPAPDIGAFEAAGPPPPPPAQIQSLAIAPKAFRAANIGAAIVSAKKKGAPVGATVTYSLSAPASVDFTVERKTVGRSVRGRCVKRTKSNAGKKRCGLFKPMKPGFAAPGAAGSNRFKFSGRIGKKSLKPGPYRLVGSAGGAIKRASFRIVK